MIQIFLESPTLLLLCSLPFLGSWLLARFSAGRHPDESFINGSPLLKSHHFTEAPPLRDPLCALARTLGAHELRGFVIGARHLPVGDVAPLLARTSRSADPELQLYAQAALRGGIEDLQATFAHFSSRHQLGASEAASFLESGLRLLESPMTDESGSKALTDKLAPVVELALRSKENHPRLIANAARVCLRTRRLQDAQELARRLPPQSPLHLDLEKRIHHHTAITAAAA